MGGTPIWICTSKVYIQIIQQRMSNRQTIPTRMKNGSINIILNKHHIIIVINLNMYRIDTFLIVCIYTDYFAEYICI